MNRSARAMGSSWIISISTAPPMLLPERDVTTEAGRSFPTLLAPDAFGSVFTGLFVGCSVASSRDGNTLPSPWPMHINSSESLLIALLDLFVRIVG
jgi:hypothetical protein